MPSFAMGNESSQLERSDAAPQRATRAIGPSMSPTPEPEDRETTQANDLAASPLPQLVAARSTPSSPDEEPSKKTKKKKRKKSFDSDATTLEAGQEEEDMAKEPARKSKKKKSRGKEPEPEVDQDDVIEDTQPEPASHEVEQPQPSPKRKRKRPKNQAIRDDDDHPLPNGVQQAGLVNGDNIHRSIESALEDRRLGDDAHLTSGAERASQARASSHAGINKEKRRRKKAGDALSSQVQPHLLAPIDGSSPPSAQPPAHIPGLRYGPPAQSDEADEVDDIEAVIPVSQQDTTHSLALDFRRFGEEIAESNSDADEIDARQIKRDHSEGEPDVEELLQSQLAGHLAANFTEAVTDPVAEAMRERDPENGLGWLHKRESTSEETHVTDTRTAHPGERDAALPYLQPSQTKTEPESDSKIASDSSTNSDTSSSEPHSHSPSAQRSERLSRSRSMSVTRGTSRSGFLADQALELLVNARPDPYAQIPYAQRPRSPPSSTGSNRSIQPRLPSPSNTGSNRNLQPRIEAEPIPAPPSPAPPGPAQPRSSELRRSNRVASNGAAANGIAIDLDPPTVQESSQAKKREDEVTAASKKDATRSQPDELDAVNGDAVASVDADAAAAVEDEASVNGDAMDVDPHVVQSASQASKRGKKVPVVRKKTAHTQPGELDAVDGEPTARADADLAVDDEALSNGDAMDVVLPVVQASSQTRKRGKKVTAISRTTTQPQPDELDAVSGNAAASADVDHEALPNGEVTDSSVKGLLSQPARRAIRATLSQNTKEPGRTQPVEEAIHDNDAEAGNVNAGLPFAKPKKQTRNRLANDNMSDSNAHVMANSLERSANGTQQSGVEEPAQHDVADDELPLDDMPVAEETQPTEDAVRASASLVVDGGSPTLPKKVTKRASRVKTGVKAPLPAEDPGSTSAPVLGTRKIAAPQNKGKKRAPRISGATEAPQIEAEPTKSGQDAESADAETAVATRADSIEPGESASQPQTKPKPKGKRRRVLSQPKESLSLSQMEADDDEEDFSTMFSRRNSTKQAAPGVSNEPDVSQAVASQAPSPEKSRKPKRKRRDAKDASEDEMESLLAAGPSKGRKSPKDLEVSDNEDGRKTKRKRLSSPGAGKATGKWAADELNALANVVNDFRNDYGMTQVAINKLVHEVPNKTDLANKDFWDKADMAVPRRTRKQIVERARRMYHNFDGRGTWTEEQKDELHGLFESHPNKWAEIAGIINRDQKDIRDYWRNNYLVNESQIKARWAKDEEERLKEVVEEALSKIRIERENNDDFRPRARAKGADDEAMIDWQQISAAMDRTRSRQQCKWKWVDMREKGLVGDDSIRLPTQPRSSVGLPTNINDGISEKLAHARSDYRTMGPEDKYRLIDAIAQSGVTVDKRIPWHTLVDDAFRRKWIRPTLRLVWYRLRQTVPDYESNDVVDNARSLTNSYGLNQKFPRFDDNAIDNIVEEQVVHYIRGKRVWKKPSADPRAVRERQRRSSGAAASDRLSQRRTSDVLDLSGTDDESEEAAPSGSRQSMELGEEGEDQDQSRRSRRAALRSDDLEVSIPGHLQGEAAKKALQQARARTKGKGKGKEKEKVQAINLDGPAEKVRGARSNSVAIDSDSD